MNNIRFTKSTLFAKCVTAFFVSVTLFTIVLMYEENRRYDKEERTKWEELRYLGFEKE